jgi:hypothetical protein
MFPIQSSVCARLAQWKSVATPFSQENSQISRVLFPIISQSGIALVLKAACRCICGHIMSFLGTPFQSSSFGVYLVLVARSLCIRLNTMTERRWQLIVLPLLYQLHRVILPDIRVNAVQGFCSFRRSPFLRYVFLLFASIVSSSLNAPKVTLVSAAPLTPPLDIEARTSVCSTISDMD